MDWGVYGYFPDAVTIAGMGVIGASGLLITLHERRRAIGRIAGPATAQ